MRNRWWLALLVLAAIFVAAFVYTRLAWSTRPAVADGPASVRETDALLAAAPRTLVVVAHPDDVEWYVGGTVARLRQAGTPVSLVVVTDGEHGRGPGPDLGAVRRAEQREAASRLGAEDLVFLGLPDSGLRAEVDLAGTIWAEWERVDPQLVLSFDAASPRLPYVHPDHQAVGRAVAAICERLAAAQPVVLLFHALRPDTLVNISTTMDVKLQALTAHATQVFGAGAQNMLRTTARTLGALGGVAFAEGYRRLNCR